MHLENQIVAKGSMEESDKNPCLFLPFEKRSKDLLRFKNCSVFSLFQQTNEHLDGFESYACILSTDPYEASNTIANILCEWNKLDNPSKLKITVG